MKILCVIDSLGSGGAQRQLVNLACGLKRRGHEVEAFIYHPRNDFFVTELQSSGVVVNSIEKQGRFDLRVMLALRALIKSRGFEAMISFLDTPSVYAIFAKLLSPSCRLIVSERSSHYHDRNRFLALVRRMLYVVADEVVANSSTQAEWLRRYSWLKRKTHVIYNGYPMPALSAQDFDVPPLRVLVVGRVGPEKNGLRIIQALEILFRRKGYIPELSWVGREDDRAEGKKYVDEMKKLLEAHPLVARSWRWLGERRDIPDLIRSHRFLLHASLYEGLPNVVCEAFIGARPVLASRVCDHEILIGDNERGVLFDPTNTESIANAISACLEMSDEQWCHKAHAARSYAEKELDLERLAHDYEALCMKF